MEAQLQETAEQMAALAAAWAAATQAGPEREEAATPARMTSRVPLGSNGKQCPHAMWALYAPLKLTMST